jgi:serine/threonine protein kinase
MSNLKKNIGKYVLDKEIGNGAFGTVYKAIDTETGKIWAVKQISKKKINTSQMKGFLEAEMSIMRDITHPNILKLEETLETDSNYYMVIQYCNQGDFENFLEKSEKNHLPEAEAVGFLKQIMNGFQELRKKKILHRDFKLPNLFLNDGVLIIGDFGLAKQGVEMTKTIVGSYYTMAPELLFNESGTSYTSKADLWSIGCVYYQMLFGEPSFFGTSVLELKNDIKKKISNGIPFPKNVSAESKDLITKLLCFDPKIRIEWDAFFRHPLFDKASQVNSEDFNLIAKALNNMAISSNKTDEEFEKNKNFLTNKQKQLNHSQENLIQIDDFGLHSQGIQSKKIIEGQITESSAKFAQMFVDADNVRQIYVHERNKIGYMDFTVQKIATQLEKPALKQFVNSLIEFGLLISKKAMVFCECILNHLKINSNFLGIDQTLFENFIKSQHVSQVISDFEVELNNVRRTFQAMTQIRQTLNSTLVYVDSINNPNVDLRVLDNNMFEIYNWLLRSTLELNDVFHISIKKDLVSILMFVKNAIYTQLNFPLVPNALFPDSKFNWEEFYQKICQINYSEALAFIQA